MLSILLTLAASGTFGYLLLKMKVPGGMIIGGIIGSGALNILTGHAFMPAEAKLLAQIVAGAFIGLTMGKSDFKRLKNLAGPIFTLLTGYMILNIVMGYLIYLFSPLDFVTALMSAVPGGISDIPIISEDMGADTSKVAIMQFARLVAGIGIFPSMIGLITRNKQDECEPHAVPVKAEAACTGSSYKQLFATIAVAVLFGFLGKCSGVPAGALLFSLIGVMILNISKVGAWLPKNFRRFAQILSGAYIGSGMVMNDLLELKYLGFPVLILISGYFLGCIIMGYIMHKRYNYTLKEAMLAATPAGASDMALISADLGIKNTDVIYLQIIRLIFVVSAFPQLINFIVMLNGR